MITIVPVTDTSGYGTFADLIREYSAWLSERLASEAWFIEAVLKHQSLDDELSMIEATYGPPNGLTVLAMRDDAVAGGVAFRQLDEGVCEMKRMFIRQQFRGHGLGRRLCRSIIEEARNRGYRLMRLDTSRRLTEAIGLYMSFDFRECPPYRTYPAELLPHLLFMEASLAPNQ